MTDTVCAVVVTHRRPDELAKSLDAVSAQTRAPDHLVVVDNDDDARVRDIVDRPADRNHLSSGRAETSVAQAVSRWACCTRWRWARTGCGWPTTTDGRWTPRCWHAAGLCSEARAGRGVADGVRHGRSAAAGVPVAPRAWPGVGRRANCATGTEDLLPGIASLFNGALFRASTLEAVGVPDLRLFVRGDETELHRRLVRSGLPFGTCLNAVYLHPQGGDEFKPILGGRMHTQYPDDPAKRYFTYRNRGYLQSSRACASWCSRSGCASAGTSWSPGATRPACGSGSGCGAWVVARNSKGLHSDVHRRGRAVAAR